MNLRCMTNIFCKHILILMVLAFLFACGQSSSEPSQTNDSLSVFTSSSHDDDDDDERGDGGDGGGQGGGTTSTLNVIAIHNSNSSQYNDNCLECHAGIPNQKSLSDSIPNAHVAMLPFTPGENSDQCVWCHRDVSNTLIHAAGQVGTFQTNIRKTVDTQLCAICHGPVGPGKQFYQNGITTSADPDGAELYRHLCAACHRELANSEVKGESTQEIYKVINEDEGGMGALNVLNPTWIQAITIALGGDPTLPTNIPTPGTGASLYQQYCSACHGPLSSSAKVGATVAQIQNGIINEAAMNSLNFLTTEQVQLIADALSGGGGTGGGGTGGGTTDGAALYTANCASCHGSLSSSDQSGATAALIQNGINNVGEMNSLSFLTTTEVQAIADALSGGGTGGGGTGGGTTDGAALYTANCANCHGSLSSSDQSGATAALIQNGINNVGEMNSLSFLTTIEVQAIADALSSGGGTGGGGSNGPPANHTDDKDGALHMPGKDTPYSSDCAACHGTTLQGDLGPSCFSCHDKKWDEDPPSGTGGTGTDGASLYAANCSTCHGGLASSSQAGASASLIQNAINNDTGGMGTLSLLTTTQVQTIADALSGGGTGGSGGGTGGGGGSGETDGTALYQSFCASCHRDISDSQVGGESANDISEAIEDNEGGMSSLEFLTDDQIDAIAAALNSDS